MRSNIETGRRIETSTIQQTTGLTPERVATLRARIAPKGVGALLERPHTPNNTSRLTAAEIDKKVLTVLGYMRERAAQYGEKAPQPTPDLGIGKTESLAKLEAQVDRYLAGEQKPDEVPTTTTETQSKKMRHRISDLFKGKRRKQIEEKHNEIKERVAPIEEKVLEQLAFPQVRARVERELEKEGAHYPTARPAMREVARIDRVSEKYRQAIYRIYLETKQGHKRITQEAVELIGALQATVDTMATRRSEVVGSASVSTKGYLETQRLLTYKQQLEDNGVALTPSRMALIDRISREAVAGNKIFLVGSTGTGKSRLAMYVLNSITGGYELINWHEGTTPRDIFGYRELWTDEKGNVQSGVKAGPLPTAISTYKGALHDEYTGGSTRTQLAMKFLTGARPGEVVHIPGFNGQAFEITNQFIEIFTGNPKDERTKQREEMDPAILRELKGINVSYMPAAELYDVIRAMLVEESGILKLGQAEMNFIKKLAHAAEFMHKLHNRDLANTPDSIKDMLGIDLHGNTNMTLNNNFLDPGTLFSLFGEWELASARGMKFTDYMTMKLQEFIDDPKTLSTPEERDTLKSILQVFVVIADENADTIELVMDGQTKGYILPSEMTGESLLSDEDPMSDEEKKWNWDEEKENLMAAERVAWKNVLGADVEVDPLPETITPEVKAELENRGFALVYRPSIEMKSVIHLQKVGPRRFLENISQNYPNWKPLESLSEDEQMDPTIVRNLEVWFWEEIANGNLKSFTSTDLKGQWIAIEKLPKPNQDEYYEDSQVTDLLQLPNRFGHSRDEINEAIANNEDYLRTEIGLPRTGTETPKVRLPSALEYNLLANRFGWASTDSFEWTSTDYVDNGQESALRIGDGSKGGAAYLYPEKLNVKIDDTGFRIGIFF